MVASNSYQAPATLRIWHREYRQMLEHLRSVYPHEGCGLLAGEDGIVTGVYEVKNQLASPSAYEMDPQQQLEAMIDIEERGWDLLAIFHSHPGGPDIPSDADVSTAYYPESLNVIVSFRNADRPSVRAYTIDERRIEEIPLIVL